VEASNEDLPHYPSIFLSLSKAPEKYLLVVQTVFLPVYPDPIALFLQAHKLL